MHPSTCAAVQPGCRVVSFLRMIAGRLAALRTASYSVARAHPRRHLLHSRECATVRLGLDRGTDHVGLPVVEVQLGGLAAISSSARWLVGLIGQRNADFVRAGALDFGLRDAGS